MKSLDSIQHIQKGRVAHVWAALSLFLFSILFSLGITQSNHTIFVPDQILLKLGIDGGSYSSTFLIPHLHLNFRI